MTSDGLKSRNSGAEGYVMSSVATQPLESHSFDKNSVSPALFLTSLCAATVWRSAAHRIS